MALFGKADARLPLITHIMQLDLDRGGDTELIAFHRLAFRQEHAEVIKFYWPRHFRVSELNAEENISGNGNVTFKGMECRISEDTARGSISIQTLNSDQPCLYFVANDEQIAELESTGQITQVEDEEWNGDETTSLWLEMKSDELETLRDLCALTQRLLNLLVRETEPDPEEYAPLQAMLKDYGEMFRETLRPPRQKGQPFERVFSIPHVSPVPFLVYRALCRAITDDWKYLSVCEECCSIFIRDPRRPSQMRCSHRCGDRAYQRKKNARKKGVGLDPLPPHPDEQPHGA